MEVLGAMGKLYAIDTYAATADLVAPADDSPYTYGREDERFEGESGEQRLRASTGAVV